MTWNDLEWTRYGSGMDLYRIWIWTGALQKYITLNMHVLYLRKMFNLEWRRYKVVNTQIHKKVMK